MTSKEPIPAWKILQRELKARNIQQKQMAGSLGISKRFANDVYWGRRRISVPLALKLGAWLDTSPEFWLDLQTNNELWHARREYANELAVIRGDRK